MTVSTILNNQKDEVINGLNNIINSLNNSLINPDDKINLRINRLINCPVCPTCSDCPTCPTCSECPTCEPKEEAGSGMTENIIIIIICLSIYMLVNKNNLNLDSIMNLIQERYIIILVSLFIMLYTIRECL